MKSNKKLLLKDFRKFYWVVKEELWLGIILNLSCNICQIHIEQKKLWQNLSWLRIQKYKENLTKIKNIFTQLRLNKNLPKTNNISPISLLKLNRNLSLHATWTRYQLVQRKSLEKLRFCLNDKEKVMFKLCALNKHNHSHLKLIKWIELDKWTGTLYKKLIKKNIIWQMEIV